MNYLLLFASLFVVCLGRRVVLRTRAGGEADVVFSRQEMGGPVVEAFRIRITDLAWDSREVMEDAVNDNDALQRFLKELEEEFYPSFGYTWSVEMKHALGAKLTYQHLGTISSKLGKIISKFNSSCILPNYMRTGKKNAEELFTHFVTNHAEDFMDLRARKHVKIVNPHLPK
eukprot:Platyproteum_vivax@DN7622_c0_g1_i12.p1